MTASRPHQVEVSVIVPVRDRRAMLAELLEALDAQTYGNFEVIVIDDGSSDGSDELARAAVVRGHPVMVLDGMGQGALAARCLGVTKSSAPVLAFTDSDCVPDPDWLTAGMAAIGDGAEMVNGFTRPRRALRPLERSVASGLEGLWPTANMFYRRDLYDRLGGFDAEAAERWRFRPTRRARGTGFGEDTLLGWQAVRSGIRTAYAPEAIVEHQVFAPDWRESFSRAAQCGAFPAMVKEIPELRDTLLRRRLFLGRSPRGAVYVFVLAVLLRQRSVAMLALAGWVGWRLRELSQSPHSTREQLPWVPAEMAVDVATAAALVAGSATSRSLVL